MNQVGFSSIVILQRGLASETDIARVAPKMLLDDFVLMIDDKYKFQNLRRLTYSLKSLWTMEMALAKITK
jgi:hypothetical protein